MQNILTTDVTDHLNEWKNSSPEERDKLVYSVVYGDILDEFCSPSFTSNNPDTALIDKLIQDLESLGFEFTIEELPRSTLAMVTYQPKNIILGPLPYHKAICLMIFILKNDIRQARMGPASTGQ